MYCNFHCDFFFLFCAGQLLVLRRIYKGPALVGLGSPIMEMNNFNERNSGAKPGALIMIKNKTRNK